MASNVPMITAKTVLADISKGHLNCSICTHRFSQPKMLQCYHSFCLECLKKLKERLDAHSAPLTCPICMKDTLLKGDDVEELAGNFRLSSVVEEVGKLELLEGQRSPSPSPPPTPPALTSELESSLSAEDEGPEEQWRLVKEIDSSIPEQHEVNNFHKLCCVASLSGGVVALESGRSEVIRITATRKGKSSGNISHRLEIDEKPSLLAVNKDCELILLCCTGYRPQVKIYDRGYLSLLRQSYLNFKEGAQASCLAVNEDNQIAIGNKTRQEISLYNPNGSLIVTVSNQRVGEHLTSYKQRWIYTDRMQRKLRAIDANGDEVFAVDMPLEVPYFLGPEGVCCDKDGDIYVALRSSWSSSNGEIHRFSADGEHLGCVIKGCGSPQGITLTTDGLLVVAAMQSVSIYRPV